MRSNCQFWAISPRSFLHWVKRRFEWTSQHFSSFYGARGWCLRVIRGLWLQNDVFFMLIWASRIKLAICLEDFPSEFFCCSTLGHVVSYFNNGREDISRCPAGIFLYTGLLYLTWRLRTCLHFKVWMVFRGECMAELPALKLGLNAMTFPDLSDYLQWDFKALKSSIYLSPQD